MGYFILIISISFLYYITEGVNRIVYGKYIFDTHLDQIMSKKLNHYWLNTIDKRIICFIPGQHIERGYFGFSRYYINDFGRVWRWSKSDKFIKDLFDELEKEKEKTFIL